MIQIGVDLSDNLFFFLLFFFQKSKRFGASLGALSDGRVGITGFGSSLLKVCMTIAIRYSAARHQFGPVNDKEIPILEYQLQVSIDSGTLFRSYKLTNDSIC